MKREEIEIQADRFYPNANVDNHQATEHQGFVKGAMWMQELFENNRLAHCDSMTEEEYNRESDFVSNFIKEHHRTPTFSDAIEITREQMIDKACDVFADMINEVLPINTSDMPYIKAFRQAITE